MLRRTYDWTMGLAARRNAMSVLAIISFIESSVFPIPPDVMIVPMVLAQRERAFRIAAVATIASVLGGLAGYGIGALLYETVGVWIIEAYGAAEQFDDMTIVVSSIHIDNSGVAKVTWSDARNTSEPAVGTTVALPSGLVRNNTYLIMAEVHYAYTPTFGEVLTGVIDLGEIFYLRPREGTQVARIN